MTGNQTSEEYKSEAQCADGKHDAELLPVWGPGELGTDPASSIDEPNSDAAPDPAEHRAGLRERLSRVFGVRILALTEGGDCRHSVSGCIWLGWGNRSNSGGSTTYSISALCATRSPRLRAGSSRASTATSGTIWSSRCWTPARTSPTIGSQNESLAALLEPQPIETPRRGFSTTAAGASVKTR